MSRKHISFAVGSKHGPRSARWIVVVEQDDVYVTTAKCRNQWHVSLHASGRWHLKEHRREPGVKRAPVVRGHRSQVAVGKYPVGLYIAIPDSCLRPSSDPERTSVPEYWFARPEYGGIVEVAIMQWNIKEVLEEWPGKAAGTELRLVYRTSYENCVGVLTRHLAPAHPVAVQCNTTVAEHTKRFKPIALDSPERRGYIAGTNGEGSISITDYAID